MDGYNARKGENVQLLEECEGQINKYAETIEKIKTVVNEGMWRYVTEAADDFRYTEEDIQSRLTRITN